MPAVVGLTLLSATVLPALWVRDAARERRARSQLFGDCLELFSSYCVTQERGAYPVLAGRYRDRQVLLEPVIDTLAWRKLPSLWLQVTVRAPLPVSGVLDYLVRPEGGEFYSPSSELPDRLPVPADWPQHALLATDERMGLPPIDRVGRHIGLFEDPQMKELVVTPRGVRLVCQLWQAERPEYLVLRQSRFSQSRLGVDRLAGLLDAATALVADLSGVSCCARAAA